MDYNRNTQQFNLEPADIEALGEPLFPAVVPESDIIKLFDRVGIRADICTSYDRTNFAPGAHRNEEELRHAKAERRLMHIMRVIEPLLSDEVLAKEIDIYLSEKQD